MAAGDVLALYGDVAPDLTTAPEALQPDGMAATLRMSLHSGEGKAIVQ